MPNASAVERFTFPVTGQQVRVVMRDDEPWFVANDVCAVLGYAHTASTMRMLREREKGEHPMHTLGGVQDLKVISEPGLYRLIMRSNRDEAEAFQDWVVEEVLPAIRKTGVYAAVPQFQLPQTFADALELAAKQARAIEAAEAKVAELEPEAARAAQTLDAHGLALVGTVAKRFGLKERALREFLYAQGILIRHGFRRNEPMARFVQSGHFEVKVILVGEPPAARSTTYVTPKGEALIWKRLHEAGVVGSPRMPGLQLALTE